MSYRYPRRSDFGSFLPPSEHFAELDGEDGKGEAARDERGHEHATCRDLAGHFQWRVFRVAARTLIDDWRADPAIATLETWRVHLWSRARIPAVLDGEPMFLGRQADVVFQPAAFRALAPLPEIASAKPPPAEPN